MISTVAKNLVTGFAMLAIHIDECNNIIASQGSLFVYLVSDSKYRFIHALEHSRLRLKEVKDEKIIQEAGFACKGVKTTIGMRNNCSN